MDDMLSGLMSFLSTDEGKEAFKSISEEILGAGEEKGSSARDKSEKTKDNEAMFEDFPAPEERMSDNNVSDIGAMLSGLIGSSEKHEDGKSTNAGSDDSGTDIGTLMNLMSGFGGKPDKNECLIAALRPFLSEKRQKKADEAIKILKLLPLIKMLKNSGVFPLLT